MARGSITGHPGPNVFAVSRSIWDDGDFALEPFTEREAWIWLISSAAWKDIKARGNAGTVNLKRGEFSFAVRFMAEKWQWSKSRVDRFIQRIENRDMVRDTSRDGSKIYIINKYNRFQVVGLPKQDADRDDCRDSSGTAAGQQRDKEETGETGKQVIQEEPPAIAGASKPPPVARFKAYPEWLDPEAWAGFLEVRRKKRAPLTDRAEKQIIAKLDRWRALGHDPTAVLDKSIENAWTTIYEPRNEGNHGNRTKPPSANDKFLSAAESLVGEYLGRSEGGDDSGFVDKIGRPLLPA